ncbi:Transmembrane domain-containing protein [Orpheovirus IHUMI-LCC2]|uniref:Transmembrane domain-containing protein n=1 Tax=Orpheovirus IHUMI-LCC2 TaxID=2023057 RepID=A0A2I2L5E8_9VIRU|nr:Transmembrane domain-containing protein [Orpheovirus IHUMI-LCC2]SNW62772.1 Transmembrane domain-containing protein [Orpheovirus IHUMI-LCC2]
MMKLKKFFEDDVVRLKNFRDDEFMKLFIYDFMSIMYIIYYVCIIYAYRTENRQNFKL